MGLTRGFCQRRGEIQNCTEINAKLLTSIPCTNLIKLQREERKEFKGQIEQPVITYTMDISGIYNEITVT